MCNLLLGNNVSESHNSDVSMTISQSGLGTDFFLVAGKYGYGPLREGRCTENYYRTTMVLEHV